MATNNLMETTKPEMIEQQIEEIRNIMNNLKIEKTEENEIIFGDESENSDYDVRMDDVKQEPGTSNFEERWKRKRNPTYEYEPYNTDPFINAEDYGYKRGFYKNREGKWKKPKEPGPVTGRLEDGILNLDCLTNGEELLKQWTAKQSLSTQIDATIRDMDAENYNKYLIYKTSGVVFNYIVDIDIPNISSMKNLEILEEIATKIYQEFLGGMSTQRATAADKHDQERVKYILHKMKICDMCEFEEFYCQFIHYYYMLESSERSAYMNVFIQKLPYPLSKTINDEFQNQKNANLIPDTLGGIAKVIRAYILLQCTKEQEKMQLINVTKCCPKFEYIPHKFGCSPNSSRRGRKPTKKPKYSRYYKRRYHTFKPWYKKKRYRMYKRKYQPKYRQRYWKNKSTQKYCPKGKKDCKCWICQEDGHYANECPNKDKRRDKVKLLEQLSQVNLEPIENDIISEEELWYLQTDEESEEENSSNESEQYFYQNNDQSEDDISIY
uniref:Coat protein n=3 Tax=Blueberry red ringspot virus TaxID=172220 RepID=I3ZMY5_9VIRU|nr:coat protein [Blueberry red ringspot virus]AFL90604.2 coat protein [Blueberry red ringspot virus]AJM71346.1 coat protein [Blueberry red ringspot virus]